MIFPNPTKSIQNALESKNSIQQYIDDKLPFKQAEIGKVYFYEEYSDTADGSPIIRNFDLINNTNENWTTTITKAPIENGDLRGVHQSFPNHTINIVGAVSQIQAEWTSQQGFLESQLRSTTAGLGRFAPKVASQVANTYNKALVNINKVKARAEGLLADARGFYQMAKALKGEDTTYERRFVAFRNALILAQRQRQTFTIGFHGQEHKNYALTQIQATQSGNNIYNMEFTLTFEYMPRVNVAKNIDPAVAKAVKTEVAKYQDTSLKSSVGERRSLISYL